MKRYFKTGLGAIIPVLLTITIVNWVVALFTSLFYKYTGIEIAWLGSIIGIIIAIVFILILGWIFTHIRPIITLVKHFESKLIAKMPFIKDIYRFGEEIREMLTSMSDEEKNNLKIFEVDLLVIKFIGIMTAPEHGIGFLVSAPSPLTGLIAKFDMNKIKYLDMNFSDLVKLNTSLGNIGGNKWKYESNNK